MTEAELVWNRACLAAPADGFPGDRALGAVIRFHSAVINGGVLHAIDILKVAEISDAKAGFQFFEVAAVPDLQFRRNGWPGIAMVSFVLGNTVLLFAVALRGVRIRSAEQLEAQSKSPTIDSLRQRLRS